MMSHPVEVKQLAAMTDEKEDWLRVSNENGVSWKSRD